MAQADNIDFDGLVNARDLGGIPLAGGGAVQPGRLYRSETPELMTPNDVVKAIDGLGIQRTIDLRGPRARGYTLGDDGRRATVDFFTMAGGMELIEDSDDGFLVSAIQRGGVPMIRFFELLVEAEGACLVHCHTGKDRTGFVSAVTLALLGAADEHIIGDYERSIPVYEPMIANLEAAGMGVPPTAPVYARRPPSQAGIRALLDRLRSAWPSPRVYLEEQGASAELLDRVVEKLCG